MHMQYMCMHYKLYHAPSSRRSARRSASRRAVYIFIYMYMYMYINISLKVYIYIYIHTYIYIYSCNTYARNIYFITNHHSEGERGGEHHEESAYHDRFNRHLTNQTSH